MPAISPEVHTVLEDLASSAATSVGLALDGLSTKRAGKKLVVTVTVDLPEDEVGSAQLDDVAACSRALSELYDESDVLGDEPYVLEVSTPGIDRPLTEPRHWKRARTRLVTATRTDGNDVSGRLVGVDEVGITLELLPLAKGHQKKPKNDAQAAPVSLSWEDVAKGRIDVEWKK